MRMRRCCIAIRYLDCKLREAAAYVLGHYFGYCAGREQRCVETQVVGSGIAPVLVGVEVVVGGAQFVGLPAELVGFGA